ncbi:cellulase family glycosylhydrolase [Chitinophaga japonensis]|uniref:Cellulase (Glycosyl hydrolase family 5) n=1 Tax=Chitinophaga japonensis TaxID=104662 RepID=A0A562SZU2_CHIJA|nr:cellulase family glycosylhydrolase [Chitinophaga japonensis]TWI86558.1 cellulase (glycosyl hydrolase family 5) [Chitinophaga japonensis]
MQKSICFAGSFLAGLLLSGVSYAQGFLKAAGTRIVNERNENVLLRGMGLGGWMLQEGYMLRVPGPGQQHTIRQRIQELTGPESTRAFYDAWLANHTRKEDIDSLKAWGFNSVRLPMHYNLYTLPVEKEPVPGQHTWLEKGFALTDSLLAWCKANRMYLILDLHAAPGGQGNDLNISDRDTSQPALWESRAQQEKTIALWRRLAERYRDEPWIGAYDILNEPNWGFTDPVNDRNGIREKNNAPLKKLMQEITAAIREVDKKHIIIIEGNGWGNNYNGILPPWDNNMALSFHKYWNYNDEASIRHILDARTKYQVPVWLGETGENSNVWFTAAIRLLESHNIGWSWWPLKKLGANNPLEIPLNAQYRQVLDYWAGKGPKPAEADARSGLLQLAADTRTGNNILHRDVIDAMMRQPADPTARPYQPNYVAGNTTLMAVNYDLGPNGGAYYDLDSANYRVVDPKLQGGNRGRTYRNDGVDIRKNGDSYAISHFESGEWLQYTLQVTQAGRYAITLAPAPGDAQVSIWMDGKKVTGKVALGAGRHVLRVQADSGASTLREIIIKNE